MTKIDLASDINPFFQVVINKTTPSFDLKFFYSAIKASVDEKNQVAINDYFSILDHKLGQNHLVVHLGHKSKPTWYGAGGSIDQSKPIHSINGIEDFENDLVIVYYIKDYLFIYANCAKVETIISEAMAKLVVNNGWSFQKLSQATIAHILQQLELQYRTLGIANVFNAGGSAPESKAYFGRNTVFSLTPGFDSGYGFSYCLAAIIDKKSGRRPFGCSTTKSKIWNTWVDNLKLFMANCDEIIRLIEKPARRKQSNLDILVVPVSKDALEKEKAIQFYMDYYVHDKGMVKLSSKTVDSFDWCCYLSEKDSSIIIFEITDASITETIEVKFNYDKLNLVFNFTMINPKETISVQFLDDNDRLSNSRNLISYLSKQANFTIVFEKGHAYRNNECYKDNRLLQAFEKHSDHIKWHDVDIRKEDKPPADKSKKFNIIEKVTHYMQAMAPLTCINDNGANEIADCIFIAKDRIVLVHAKFSKSKVAGLRVDDLQVVVSQAVKNLRFFGPSPYTDEVFKRLYKKCPNQSSIKDANHFQEAILEKLNDARVKRECWIVQPGISAKELTVKKKNKIHALLNFVDSVFTMNQVEFKLYCNA